MPTTIPNEERLLPAPEQLELPDYLMGSYLSELAKLGILPIGHITFPGCRRSFASLRRYGGKSHRQTADLLGHEDVQFTLNVYAQSGLDPDEMLPPVRRAFDWAIEWAAMGSNEPLTVPELESVER